MINLNLSAHLSQAYIALNRKIGKTTPPLVKNNIKLSRIEYTILFLMFLGKSSPTEIAQIITKLENKPLSKSFVLYVLYDNLYRKFKVNKTSELIEKAVLMNTLTFFPKSIC